MRVWHVLLTEFDEVQVGGCRGQPPDVQVGFTQLFPAGTAAVTAAAGAGWSHGVRLQETGSTQETVTHFSGGKCYSGLNNTDLLDVSMEEQRIGRDNINI